MADLLQQGAQFLTDTRTAHMSRSVTYHPAAGGSATVTASIGKSLFSQESPDHPGVAIESESRDYIVEAGALAADPVKGDRIKEPIGDGTEVNVYEVCAPGDAPVFKQGDAHRTCIRIHTKFVKTEAA